jgi:hypothetical protein
MTQASNYPELIEVCQVAGGPMTDRVVGTDASGGDRTPGKARLGLDPYLGGGLATGAGRCLKTSPIFLLRGSKIPRKAQKASCNTGPEIGFAKGAQSD